LIPSTFDHAPFKFSIIVAGFKPTMQEATNVMLTEKSKVKTPSLHFIGELDTLVLPEAMESLARAFENPKIFRHSGG
jgi:alpha-beta hydrolase superfamily lysophospholipase